MGEHEARGATASATERDDDLDHWRDEQITVVEKRREKTTTQGMPALVRPPASKRD